MKSKKLLISLIVVALVVVAIVVLVSVFTLRDVIVVCHKFEGGKILPDDDAPNAQEIAALFAGKGIVFLNKEDALKQLNELYPDYHFFQIVKIPPNAMEVHFLKRSVVAKLDVGGKDVYLDSYGYQVSAPADGTAVLDISSAFITPIVQQESATGPFKFENSINNQRLSCILECFIGMWRCYVDTENFPVFGTENVFTFDSDGTMTITMPVGAKIHIMNPHEDMYVKIKNALSVYYSAENNLQQPGVEITVWQDGKVTTPGKK